MTPSTISPETLAALKELFPHGGHVSFIARNAHRLGTPIPEVVEELAQWADAGFLPPSTRADVERLLGAEP